MMASFLLAFVAMVGAVNSAAIGEESNYGDSEWPVGISPLDSLSYWRNGEKKASNADKKKPCCLPKLWTGRLFTEYRLETPVGKITYHYEHVLYFDQAKKRLANNLIVGNKIYESHILLFNKTGATQYTFSKKTKRCSKEFLPGTKIRQQCIPANATLLRAFCLGAGRGALRTQLWDYSSRDRRVDRSSSLLVTPEDCVPVTSAFRSTSRDARMMDTESQKKKETSEYIGTLYTDIKTKIADQSVFKPPSFCKKREDEEEEEEEKEEDEEEDEKLYFDGDHQDFHINKLIGSFVAVP